jgi:chaperone required for assembly of F1-ATPase
MRKVAVLVALVMGLSMTACTCTVAKKAVDEVDRSHGLISTQLLKYVDKDASLNSAAKEDWKKLVESDKRNIEALKKALED